LNLQFFTVAAFRKQGSPPNPAVSSLNWRITIMLEIRGNESNINVRRSSGVCSPWSSVGEGTFIEATAFAGKIAHISLN
jgi:hypothetical protein